MLDLVEPAALIFMRAGPHRGLDGHPESLAAIIERKMAEEQRVGHAYWGYGGSFCTPPRVREFVEQQLNAHRMPEVLMVQTCSYPSGVPPSVAKEYSVIGENGPFEALPPGAAVSAARYALVLRNLRPGAFRFDPSRYAILSAKEHGGRTLADLHTRVDKALAVRSDQPGTGLRLVFGVVAELVEPYTVFLRPPN